MITAIVLLIITLIISFFSFKNDRIFYMNLFPNRLYEIWRPFTYSFVHNNKEHLIFNVLFYCIGFLGFFQKFDNMEFLKFYFLSSIFSVIPFIFLNINNKFKSVSGNSGVTFSIFYGFIALDPFSKWGLLGYGLPAYIFGIIYFLVSLKEATLNKNVSLISHISGILFGIIYVLVYK
jgi:membrane associated rhomboid family serine protease